MNSKNYLQATKALMVQNLSAEAVMEKSAAIFVSAPIL